MSRGFRVWDKQTKSYEWDREFVLSSSGELMELYSNHNGTWEYHFADTNRFIIKFETGIKDKNGKEIYEGDIVEEDIDFNSKMTDGTFRYKVYWNEDELCWSLDPISSESIHNDLWELNSSCRVIGNIHENPELLEGEK